MNQTPLKQLKLFGARPEKIITKHRKNGTTGMRPIDLLPKIDHFQKMRDAVGSSGPTSGVQFSGEEDNFVTDTIGMQTNNLIPYSKITKKYHLPIMTGLQNRQIMITKKDKGTSLLNEDEKPGNRRYVMANIPAWNWLNYALESQPLNPDNVQSADELWDKWTIEGIVRSEEGELTQWDQPHLEHEQERLFNTAIRGEIDTFDIWQTEKSVGTKLFLILKKLKKDDKMALGFNLNPYNLMGSGSIYKSKKKSTHPFQLVPYANKNFSYPPLEELEYEDEFGFKHHGKVIYIGAVKDIDNPYNEVTYNEKVRSDINAILTQQKITIYLNPTQ